MNEKILIKSEKYSCKKLIIALLLIGFLITLFLQISNFSDALSYYDSRYEEYCEDNEGGRCFCWSCDRFRDEYGSKPSRSNVISEELASDDFTRFCLPFVFFALVSVVIYFWLRSYELTVTDKRIYGRIAFGKRVDLPNDSVSATSTTRFLKGIVISTASGKISFRMVKNVDEIYQVVNDLLIERQQTKAAPTVTEVVQKSDEADQLKKYKDLLDSGVITQEEFDAKKKQLLGL